MKGISDEDRQEVKDNAATLVMGAKILQKKIAKRICSYMLAYDFEVSSLPRELKIELWNFARICCEQSLEIAKGEKS